MPVHALLLSSGFSNPFLLALVCELAADRLYKKVQIVITAHPQGSESQWAILTKHQFEEMGLSITYTDFMNGEGIEDDTDIVYVCGGNTFRLLKSIQDSPKSIRIALENLFRRGGLYVGTSAGAAIMGEHIHSAEVIGGDKNNLQIKDYSGLHFTDTYIIPHYQESLNEKIDLFAQQYSIEKERLLPLMDGEGLYISDGKEYILRDINE